MTKLLEADVIIVGAGIAGTMTAYRLAQSGAQVVALDSGPRVNRALALASYRKAVRKTPESPYPRVVHAPTSTVDEVGADTYYKQSGPDLFKSSYLRLVGGTTWHWLGTTLRLLPSDFSMRSLFGVGADWPITYDELEPWYFAAEQEMGVAGQGDLGSRRNAPYPMAPIPLSYSDLRIKQAIAGLGYRVTTTPQARNTQVYDHRPVCCGQASCIPLCPTGARYDASVHVRKAEQAGVHIVENAVAYKIEVDKTGTISGILCRHPDGSKIRARGKIYVVAAHAIETPKLLLMSRTDKLPQGIANSSDQLGRNLMDHPIQLSWALAKNPLGQYRGPLSTAGIDSTRWPDTRDRLAAFRVQFGNNGWQWPKGGPETRVAKLVAKGLRGRALAEALAEHSSRELVLSSLMEELPHADNRVQADWDNLDAFGLPRPRITYKVHRYTRDGMAQAKHIHQQIFQALSSSEVQHASEHQGAGHVMGTYRMGANAQHSVVDRELRSHDHANLFLLGSGVFPTAGSANPTLTIAALSLRAAATIAADLSNWPSSNIAPNNQ